MNALIIDDEKNAQSALAQLVNIYLLEIENCFLAESFQSGLELLSRNTIEIIFMDIEMPQMSGIEAVRYLQKTNRRPQIIFVTAHDIHAMDALKLEAVDYLLKPVDPEELVIAFAKAKERISKSVQIQSISNTSANPESRVVLEESGSVKLIKPVQISFVKAERAYAKFVLADGSSSIVSKPLKYYEPQLLQQNFFRTHRSYLVNLAQINRVKWNEGLCVVLENGVELPLAKERKTELLNRLCI